MSKGQTGRERQTSERGNGGQCLVFQCCTNEARDTDWKQQYCSAPALVNKSYAASDTLKHMYSHVYVCRTLWLAHIWQQTYNATSTCTCQSVALATKHSFLSYFFVHLIHLHLFKILWNFCKRLSVSWRALNEPGWAVEDDAFRQTRHYNLSPVCYPDISYDWALANLLTISQSYQML